METEDLGDKINIKLLAIKLSRPTTSVEQRIRKLKTGTSQEQHRAFSLTEDLVILDRVLENLSGKSLKEFNLYDKQVATEIASGFGRLTDSRF